MSLLSLCARPLLVQEKKGSTYCTIVYVCIVHVCIVYACMYVCNDSLVCFLLTVATYLSTHAICILLMIL